MKPGFSKVLAWTMLIAGLAVTGGLLIFTQFMVYDDEGYVLWSVRGFCEGSPLYTEVYSQYGPLLFIFYRTVHAATGLIFDNDSARLLNLGYWLASAALAGALAQQLCRRLAAGLAAGALTFVTLISNTNEPFHPGALLALLVAIATFMGARQIDHREESGLLWKVALFATAACLIKINVGAFLFTALASWAWLGLSLPNSKALNRIGLVAAIILALPLALMRDHLGDGPTRDTALVFICGGLALLTERARDRSVCIGGRDWLSAALASLALAAGVIGVTVSSGTHPADLLEGVLLAPLRHPGVYVFQPSFPPLAVVLAPLSLIGAVWLSRRPGGTRTQTVLALAKIAAALAFFAQGPRTLGEMPLDRFAYYFGPSLAWLLVAPLGPDQKHTTRIARWIAWVFIWQTLQAFPVAGSQVAWGSFLWVPLSVYGLFQAGEYFARSRAVFRHCATSLAGLGGIVAVGTCLRYGLDCLQDSKPLGLPGAHWVRPPPETAEILRIVTRNLQLHAGTVFSLPGAFSLNIWSEKPTPTRANVTHWFNLLDENRQVEISARLEADATAIVVLQRDHLRYLIEAGIQPSGTLHDYIVTQFVPLARIGGYDLWGHRERRLDIVDSFTAVPNGVVSVTERLPRPPRTAILLLPGSPALKLTWAPAEPSFHPGLERQFFALQGLRREILSSSARLVLLDAEGAELAYLRPNLAPLTASAPPAAD